MFQPLGRVSLATAIAGAMVIAIAAATPVWSAEPLTSSAAGASLVPLPKRVQMAGARVPLRAAARIVASRPDLMPLAKVLADEVRRLTGLDLATGDGPAKAGDIVLKIDPSLRGEAYTLDLSAASFTVAGGDYNAVASGTVTLLQAIDVADGAATVASLSVRDEPTYPFRAVLLDLARKYHTISGIKQVVEMARFYKVRYVHLNLSDDQLFMFPSTAFPNAGKGNNEFARFESASKPRIEPYTLAELKDLEQFAKERGVYLMPEINLPGHAGRLVGDEPETFAFPGNGSTVNIASPKVLKAAETLLNEMMDVFESSPYVHLAADEVSLGGLEETPEYRQAVKDDPRIKNAHDLFGKFVQHIHGVVTKRGKKAVVWEEAWNATGPFPLPKEAVVMVWSRGRNPNDIAKSGYSIANATWTPLYIVRDDKRPLSFLFDWKLTQFGQQRSDNYVPLEPTLANKLVGTELCSWENSEAIEVQSLRDRLALVAERSWNASTGGTFEQFQQRLAGTDAKLEKLVNPIGIKVTAGQLVRDESTFNDPITIELQPRQEGLTLRYTLDNSLPNEKWKTYSGPITLDDTAYLRAGLFDASGQQQGYLVGSWYKRINVIKPNLATNRPVTVGPGPDRDDAWAAKAAVDGKADDIGLHWASTDGTPQWLRVDLGSVQPIDYVNVITYSDGGRYYQFFVEASVDGQTWKRVADYSDNTIPATMGGYPAKFDKTDARYVRVTVTKNSANPSAHIVELIVNKAK